MSADRFSRIFDVLELLAGSTHAMTVTEIATRLSLPISSTHNMLQRMVESDAVTAIDGPRYLVGARAVRLGIRVVEGLHVRMTARRHLQELARDTGEDVYLAVRHGRRVVYVDRVHGSRPVTVEIRLGQSLYLHATSVGKLFATHDSQMRLRLFNERRRRLTDQTLTEPEELQAELDRILRDGFAASREEAIEGIVGFAVPVFRADGKLAAAIHISSLRAQMTRRRQHDLVTRTAATARSVESDLEQLHSRSHAGPMDSGEASSGVDGRPIRGRQRSTRSGADGSAADANLA